MASRFYTRFALAAAFTCAIPATTRAQTRLWSDCPLGTFQACNSILVSRAPIQNAQSSATSGEGVWVTAVTVRIRSAGLIQGLRFDELGRLTYPAPAYSGTWMDEQAVSPLFEGTARAIGTGSVWSGWWLVYSLGQDQSAPVTIERDALWGANPVVGCDPLTPDANGLYVGRYPGYFQTCGEGWVVYSWTTPPLQFTDATTLSYPGLTYRGVCGGSGIDCPAYAPEPATIVLLGTGLLSIGALRRRRRKQGIVDT